MPYSCSAARCSHFSASSLFCATPPSFCITYIKAVLRLGITLFGGGFVPLEGRFCILLHRLAAHIGHGQIFLCGQFAALCPCQQVFPIAAGGILAADLRQCRSVIGILFGQ